VGNLATQESWQIILFWNYKDIRKYIEIMSFQANVKTLAPLFFKMGGHILVLLALLSLGELRQSHRYKKSRTLIVYVYYFFTISYFFYRKFCIFYRKFCYVTRTTLLFTNNNSSEGNKFLAVSNGNEVIFILCKVIV